MRRRFAADLDVPGGDLFSIPLLMNLRATFPVWILDLYGGGGIGSTYSDFESNSIDVEGWLFSGDLVAGAELALRERMTVGLELKYHFTEEIERTDDHFDSLAVMATIGWRFCAIQPRLRAPRAGDLAWNSSGSS